MGWYLKSLTRKLLDPVLVFPDVHSEMLNVSTNESKRTNFFGSGFLRGGHKEHMAILTVEEVSVFGGIVDTLPG